MFDSLPQFFEINPTGPFESLSFFMILSTVVLAISIIFLVILRVRNPQKDIRNFLNKIPMYLFYFALAGYFLVVFRLSKTPVLGARFMWAIWALGMIWIGVTSYRKYLQTKKLAARKQANKESGVEVVDPYLEAHFGKKPQSKKKVTVIKA